MDAAVSLFLIFFAIVSVIALAAMGAFDTQNNSQGQ